MSVYHLLCRGVVLFLLSIPLAHAENHSPKGLWQMADYESVQPRFQMQISEYMGEYQATIVKVLLAKDKSATCQQCDDFRAGQPLAGLMLISGLTKDANEQTYSGGEIVDPDSGKVYRCKMELSEMGDELAVRAYTLNPIFGHSKIWKRIK